MDLLFLSIHIPAYARSFFARMTLPLSTACKVARRRAREASAPSKIWGNVGQDRLDHVSAAVDAELVGDGQEQRVGPTEMRAEPVGNFFGCFVSFNDVGVFRQLCPGAAPLQFLNELGRGASSVRL